MFASVDGSGYIDLWDLSKDFSAPIVKEQASTSAVNKIAWN